MLNDKQLFAVAATFNDPNKIIAAAKRVSSSGYKKFDVNTPYPLHGMDGAMKLKSSKLGFVTLAMGLSGAGFALLLMWYAMSYDYPMIIGGKPFFSLPAFIPVTFELTVLFATIATVLGMIAFFFNLPGNSYPLHDTNYMKSVSADKFGIYIEASDNKFHAEEVRAMFTELGAETIEDIIVPVKETYPLFQPKFIMFLVVTFLVVSGLTYFVLNHLVFMEPFNWMMVQDKTTPQERSDYFKDGFAMRMPVKGTVAKGFIPYADMGKPSPSDSSMMNPVMVTEQSLALGERKYLTFCSPCHGNYADGDSRLRGQFVNPPTLHSERARNMSDATLYHIITNGQNSMPSYAPQVTREERWAIVNHLRVLQRAKNASPEDVQLVKKEIGNNGQ